MATWTDITNGQIDTDSPVTQPLMTAYRENLPATVEGSDGAPVVATGWHPYDMVTVGDGEDGMIYDFTVDGAASTITSPSMEDGYEYAFLLEDLGVGSGSTPNFEIRLSSGGTYQIILTISDLTTTDGFYGKIEFPLCRTLSRFHIVDAKISNGAESRVTPVGTYQASELRMANARITASENFVSGKVYWLRRREYVTG